MAIQRSLRRPIRSRTANQPVLQFTAYTLCLKKNVPDIFNCNLTVTWQPIITFFIIFGTNIPDTTCYQMTIQFSTSPSICFCTTWENTTSEISLFYPMRYDCLINVMRKNTFCSHFWHFGWQFIQLSIFQLPAVKLFEVFAHYANTGRETISPFIDNSINNVLLQTNPGCTSRFLTSQTFLNFIW